ncbi:MAG TPA: DUF3298 domain-containing protein [Chitinophagaceae bacterium]|nr:DUF3298 domain-containing protein [Chitinophagaceae bacterium]
MTKNGLLFVLVIGVLHPCIAIGQGAGWYKSYRGNIDKYPVVMNLYKKGHSYSGYYYYTSQQKPIYFTGEDTSLPGGKIKLSVFLPDNESEESFIFSIMDKLAGGEWSSGKKTPLAFSAGETDQPLTFDYIYTEGSTPLRPKLKESPSATFEAASVWPKRNTPQATLLKKIIREQFGEKNSVEDIGKIFLRQKKKFFTDYINDNKEMKDEDLKEAYSYNFDESSQVIIAYQTSKLIVLSGSYYTYTGGAHGNYSTSYIPVDLVSNKKLSLNDVINKAGQTKLAKLLEKAFRKDYSLKDTDPLTEGGLFENQIEPNNNFYVTSKGIGFCYNPYEIGPYAMGEINIYISFTELTAYLQPGFKKLIQ